MKKKVKQVKFSCWGEDVGTEHEGYFSKISQIAQLISNELEAFKMNVAKYNYYVHKHSTICVRQAKEKFGDVRMYTTLADTRATEHKFREKNKLTEFDVINQDEFDKFREECLFNDIRHYRRTFLKFKNLFPQYWQAISQAADYSEYLYETKKEFEKALKSSEWLGKRLSKEDIDYIYKVCGWEHELLKNNK